MIQFIINLITKRKPMLTVIKKGVNVPTLEKVVAFDKNNKPVIGFLTYMESSDSYCCNSDHDFMTGVTKFITLNNLLNG